MPIRQTIIYDAPSQMTVSYDTDHSAGFNYTQGTEHFWLHLRLGAMYGRPKLPPLTYRFPKHGPVGNPDRLAWLNPAPPMTEWPPDQWVLQFPPEPVAYHLIESVSNAWADMGPFSIVGGTITYDNEKGWQAVMNPAPLSWEGDELTLADLDKAGRPDLSLDRAIVGTVSDLQHVTHV